MVQFDNQYRQIKIKIVYYGPALGGKTTCLQHVHQVTDPQRRTKLYSLNTASDRTLFFDLLSFNLGRIRGYRLSMQLYTVPGQVQYNATRRAVLSGADGIVFVADSQAGQGDANRASLDNLWENLAANGLDRTTTPLVLMYNKRDLESARPLEELEAELNPGGLPAFPSVAILGDGVMEGFVAVTERTLAAVADKLGVGTSPQAVQRLQEQARLALQALAPEVLEDDAPTDVAVTLPVAGASADEPLDHEALVGEAVRANLAMTDLNARLDTLGRQLERKVEVLCGIGEFAANAARERDPQALWRLMLTAVHRLLDLQGVTVIEVPSTGPPREAAVHGFGRDPLLAAADDAGEPLALRLLEASRPVLLARRDDGGGDAFVEALENAGFTSAIAVPMTSLDRVGGLVVGYRDACHSALDADDVQLATILATHAAVAHDNARAWYDLEELSRGLDREVSSRTADLRRSLDEVERLNGELVASNDRLEHAYRELASFDRIRGTLLDRVSTGLREPVTALATAAKLLCEGNGGTGTAERYAAIIRDQAARLVDIVHSVHQASLLGRPSADELVLQTVEVQVLLRRVIAPLREMLQARRVRLHVLVAPGVKTVQCDPGQLEGAIRSVLHNAVEYNQPNGEVTLEVRRLVDPESCGVRIQVADTGIGIPADELEHVFEPFWRGRGAAVNGHQGLGLGLPVARRVAENHGGRLSITSAPGDGTCVAVDLPQPD